MTKILVVEDDKIIQSLLIHCLQEKNYNVLVASNGVEGVAVAHSERPDLILMDMRLPLLSGWQATKQLKTSPDTGNIPIIALTAQTLAEDRQKCLDAGCDAYTAKPIHFSTLFGQIEALLGHNSTPIT